MRDSQGRPPIVGMAVSVLVSCGFLWSLMSCELLPVHVTVLARLPSTPAVWEAAWGPADYRVSVHSVTGSTVVQGLTPAGTSLPLELPRLPPVGVIARPVWRGVGPALAGDESLATAGAIWPLSGPVMGPAADMEGDSAAGAQGSGRGPADILVLDYAVGPAAELLRRLATAGVNVTEFNWERFLAEMSLQAMADPWALDLDHLAAAIAERAMRESYVREREMHATGLRAPPGVWHPVSPFAAPVASGAAWPPLPEGVSRFYSADGARWVVRVDAAGRGWQPAVARQQRLRMRGGGENRR